MKPYLILIPILLLAFCQGVFLKLNLLLLLVLTWAVIRPMKETFVVAFLAGLFLDLAKGTPLGFSSLLFLLAVFLVVLYARRFDPAHPAFLFVFVFFASLSFNLILEKPWLIEGLILSILSLFTRPFLRYYRPDFDRHGIRLKIE